MHLYRAIILAVLSRACIAVATIISFGVAQAGEWPEKPIRLIVPFPPGGATDILSRQVGQKLSESLNQTVVIENRGGAGGNIGTGIAARATPDGYTLLLDPGSTLAISPLLYNELPFDPIKSFAPVSILAVTPYVLAVHPSVKAKSVEELIALMKAHPGELTYGSSGNGQMTHLGGALFSIKTGVSMLHIPYNGAGPSINALVGGQVSLMFGNMGSLLPHISGHTVVPLAVTTGKRTPLLPSLPTIAESGLPDYEINEWFGILAPAGTPEPIITKLNSVLAKILTDPQMAEKLAKQGFTPMSSTPDEFSKLIRDDMAKWGKVIKQANIRQN